MSKILIWETLAKIGGGQEMTLKVAQILKNNHEIHFLIPEKGELSEELEKMGISYTLMGDQSMPKGQKGVKGLLRFAYLTVKASILGKKIVSKIKPDFIYAPGPAALAWSAMCGGKTAVVWHLHHIFQSGATLKLLNFLSARKCVKRIISVSDYVADQIKNEKAHNKKITIYNPVEMVGENIKRKNICDEFPALNKKLKIAQIGFITPTKNQKLSIEILSVLKNRGIDVSLAIIGSVPEDEKWYKQLLCEKIEAYGLCDNVVFTGYRNDISEIISSFDCVLVPSVEGFSLVATQAILSNVPVLCVDNSGCTEIIKATCCGMIYSHDSDVETVCDTLLKTTQINVKEQMKKHPEFLLTECSCENFSKKITEVFTL